MNTYPHKCTRCGLCCLSENCILAQRAYNIPRYGTLCPSLKFKGDVASCNVVDALAEEERLAMGWGVGCCIKARIIRDGKEIDFASASPQYKIQAVRQRRQQYA